MLLFVLFYDEEPFSLQWKTTISYVIAVIIISSIFNIYSRYSSRMIFQAMLLFCFLKLSHYRKNLNKTNGSIVTLVYVIIITVTMISSNPFLTVGENSPYIYFNYINYLTLTIIATLMFVILELIFKNYQSSFEKSTRYFQQNVLHNQYEEIKNIYLNMRGWRHDYHSHLQTIKAHLALNQLDEVQKYLLDLEKDLSRVDSYVKSGNLMADAILNSKITIAENKNINVICKAELPEQLIISDIDMCIILGNLLDNAIEACMQIEEDKRFIRIYISMMKNQLYISIQNSSKEELNFNERHYISTKRGEHGLGMKRAKVLIDKYNGYLNLQNEPGIFASEVTVPLV
jgi:sensor histidine kinase YesM